MWGEYRSIVNHDRLCVVNNGCVGVKNWIVSCRNEYHAEVSAAALSITFAFEYRARVFVCGFWVNTKQLPNVGSRLFTYRVTRTITHVILHISSKYEVTSVARQPTWHDSILHVKMNPDPTILSLPRSKISLWWGRAVNVDFHITEVPLSTWLPGCDQCHNCTVKESLWNLHSDNCCSHSQSTIQLIHCAILSLFGSGQSRSCTKVVNLS